MTPAQLETQRKLLQCPHFDWMVGMVYRHRTHQERCVAIPANLDDLRSPGRVEDFGIVLQIDDPATIGCLAHLACEAHGCHLWAKLENGTYYIDRTNPDIPTRTIQVASGPCLGSAWAAAILAAPEPTP